MSIRNEEDSSINFISQVFVGFIVIALYILISLFTLGIVYKWYDLSLARRILRLITSILSDLPHPYGKFTLTLFEGKVIYS